MPATTDSACNGQLCLPFTPAPVRGCLGNWLLPSMRSSGFGLSPVRVRLQLLTALSSPIFPLSFHPHWDLFQSLDIDSHLLSGRHPPPPHTPCPCLCPVAREALPIYTSVFIPLGEWGPFIQCHSPAFSCPSTEPLSTGTWTTLWSLPFSLCLVDAAWNAYLPCPPVKLLLIPQNRLQLSLFGEASPVPGGVSSSFLCEVRGLVWLHFSLTHCAIKIAVWEGLESLQGEARPLVLATVRSGKVARPL